MNRHLDAVGMIGRQLVRRVLLFVPTLVLVLTGVALLASLVPGDPAVAALGEEATPEARAAYRAELGLDRPVWVQLWDYVVRLVQGDLGVSATTREPVLSAIGSRAGVTIALVTIAVLIAAVVGISLGVVSGLRPNGWLARRIDAISSAGVALPEFWVGLLLSYFVGIELGWLPPSGYVPPQEGLLDFASHIILPAVALGMAPAAELCRQTRASVIDVATRDYIRTCRANGLTTRAVIGRHVLKNAAIPLVTVMALQVPRLIGGAALVESIFNIQGVGSLAVSAALGSDLVTVQGIVAIVAIVVLAANLLADVSYLFLDPRLRTQ